MYKKTFRLKEIRVVGGFFILYTIIVSFHLLRHLEQSQSDHLNKGLVPSNMNAWTRQDVGLGDVIKTVTAGMNETAIRELRRRMQSDVLLRVLLNKDPRTLSKPPGGRSIRAGVNFGQDGRRYNTSNISIDRLASITPPGHLGVPVVIRPETLSAEDKRKYVQGWKDHSFNQFASDMIPLDRILPDLRHPECRKLPYDWNLPSMSVIICFHNEAWSALLRTVHSVIKTTPPHLLTEVLLVDDLSTLDHLKEPLEKYVATLRNVKVIRTTKRQGLVGARLLGSVHARAEVITFLDSHCECVMGWAEPMLARVKENSSTVVWPIIAVIADDTFQFQHVERLPSSKGGFYWDLNFRWIAIGGNDYRVSLTSPISSPTMAGGLFTINKKYFQHLGMYDPELKLWGAENMELSFKIWMCGGQLQIIPCSIVGHVFRKVSPMYFPADVIRRNAQRVAEVWLDDYKDIYYEHVGRKLDNMGDISSQLELRSRLKCQDFNWYIKNVYPEVFIPSQSQHRGSISADAVLGYCLDTVITNAHDQAVRYYPCHLTTSRLTQTWYLTEFGEIRSGYNCLDVGLDQTFRTVMMGKCHGLKGNQHWVYRKDRTMYQDNSDSCLTVDRHVFTISLQECTGASTQKWTWRPYNRFH